MVISDRRRHNADDYFLELESLDSDSPDVGFLHLVSRSAGAIFHSPFSLPAVFLFAIGVAVFGLVLSPVFLNPATAFPAHLLFSLRLRAMVYGHLHKFLHVGGLGEPALP